jgi:hypothetical protein
MSKCENCGDYAPTTGGLCRLCQIAEREDERRSMKLRVPKVTPTTYASSTKKAIKQKSKKKWKV